jgi:hypothetical protein
VEVGALCHEVLAFLGRQTLSALTLTDFTVHREDLSR